MFPTGGGGTWTFGLHQDPKEAYTAKELENLAKGKQFLQAAAGMARGTARGVARAPSRLGDSIKRRASIAESGGGGRASRLDRLKEKLQSTAESSSEHGCTFKGYTGANQPERPSSAATVVARFAKTPEPLAPRVAKRPRPMSLQVLPPARRNTLLSTETQGLTRKPSISARRALSNLGTFKNKVTKPVVLAPPSDNKKWETSRSPSPTPSIASVASAASDASIVTVVKWNQMPPGRRPRNKLTAVEMLKELVEEPEDAAETFFRCDIYAADGSDFVHAIEECMAYVRRAGGQVLEGEWTYSGGFLYDMSVTPDDNPLKDGDPTPASGYIRVLPWHPYSRATYRPAPDDEKDKYPLRRRRNGTAQTFIRRQKEKARQRKSEAEALMLAQSSAVSAISALSQGVSLLTVDTARLGSIMYPESVFGDQNEEPVVMVASPVRMTPIRPHLVNITRPSG